MLYASAENLGKYKNAHLDDDRIAQNRHRYFFENYVGECYFPDVHIAPINNGGLVNIIGYVAMKLYPDFKFKEPRELLEGVAFANFGKFSIRLENGKKNIDYAGNYNKLSQSIEYVKADLRILKPEILIIPKTIFQHSEIKKLFKDEFPDIKIIPIFQIHHFNINGKNRLGTYDKKDESLLGVLNEWQENFCRGIKGKTKENFYRFYTYLDEQIEKIKQNDHSLQM